MGLVFSLSFYLNELVSGGLGINGDSISASWLRSFKSFVLEKDNIQPLTGRFILKWQLWQCLIVTHCKTKQPQIFFHRLEWWRMIHHRLVPNPRIRTESESRVESRRSLRVKADDPKKDQSRRSRSKADDPWVKADDPSKSRRSFVKADDLLGSKQTILGSKQTIQD